MRQADDSPDRPDGGPSDLDVAGEALLGRDSLRQSDLLHQRVRRFAQMATSPPLVRPPDADTFETLALDITRFQLAQSPALARLHERHGGLLSCLEDIPTVPVDAFRLARVAVHPPELDALLFKTSGTTSAESGRHPVRDPRTYNELALLLARQSLFARQDRGVIVALAENPGEHPSSSLAYMMRLFMEQHDGRALVPDPRGAPFSSLAPERWLIRQGQLQVDALQRATSIARTRSEPLFILSTAFAMAALIEQLEGERLRLPSETFIMVTGGFKGRKSSLNAKDLRSATAEVFGIEKERILGEYGMTELTSQLYEGWSGGAKRAVPADPVKAALAPSWWPEQGCPELFFPPPWLAVSARDPASGRRVPPGEEGIARFIDLGNVDSVIAIQTEDLIREVEGGVQLIGRRTGATARGCSLPYEGLISGGAL